MCQRPDCPTKENPRSRYLKYWEDVAKNPMFTKGLDMMPDGYHAKPQRLWATKPQLRHMEASLDDMQLQHKRKKMRRQYMKLPEPRPDYYAWLVQMTDEERFWDTFALTKNAEYPSDRIKAGGQLQDMKVKPKVQLELSDGGKLSGTDNLDLLRKVLELNGLEPGIADQLIKPLLKPHADKKLKAN